MTPFRIVRGFEMGVTRTFCFSSGSVRASSISIRASPAACSRRLRSFAKHRRRRRRIPDGVSPGSFLQSGSPRITAARMSPAVSPGNARSRVNISYNTAPNAKCRFGGPAPLHSPAPGRLRLSRDRRSVKITESGDFSFAKSASFAISSNCNHFESNAIARQPTCLVSKGHGLNSVTASGYSYGPMETVWRHRSSLCRGS